MNFNDWDSTTTYATIDNLNKALDKKNLKKNIHLVVQVPTGKNQGRFTAVFGFNSTGTDAAFEGFKTIG